MLFPASHKGHIITFRGEPRTCKSVVKKKRKRAFARNRTSVAQLAFSQSNRKTNRFCFVKTSVQFFPVRYTQRLKLFLVMGCPDLSAVRILLLKTRHLISTGICHFFSYPNFPPHESFLSVISLPFSRASFTYSENIKKCRPFVSRGGISRRGITPRIPNIAVGWG